jgi:hypothetical protein
VNFPFGQATEFRSRLLLIHNRFESRSASISLILSIVLLILYSINVHVPLLVYGLLLHIDRYHITSIALESQIRCSTHSIHRWFEDVLNGPFEADLIFFVKSACFPVYGQSYGPCLVDNITRIRIVRRVSRKGASVQCP